MRLETPAEVRRKHRATLRPGLLVGEIIVAIAGLQYRLMPMDAFEIRVEVLADEQRDPQD